MYLALTASADTYITDRVIDEERQHTANLGAANSLDLFKLYGITSSGSAPNIELSRLLVRFDLGVLRSLIADRKLDASHNSFECRLRLYDVYGGQPTPRNFTVKVHPLSRSFVEGLGRDIVLYGDNDVSNFLTSTHADGLWHTSGANLGGPAEIPVDYITTAIVNGSVTSMAATQTFSFDENLDVDVTSVISATLANIIPDRGFRIAFDSSLETDQHTYFVKRFGARTAYNSFKHPQLIVKFNDSIQDDGNNAHVDVSGSLFLHNYVNGQLTNLMSGSSQLTGSNCIALKLITEHSGTTLTLGFIGSQHKLGIHDVVGVYSASFYVASSNTIVAAKLLQSASLTFTPIWGSLDGTVPFLTGTTITVRHPSRQNVPKDLQNLSLNALGLPAEVSINEVPLIRINVFDPYAPLITLAKLPIELSGIVYRRAHYIIRCVETGEVVVPADPIKNSTLLSSDQRGMWFYLQPASLIPEKSYVIDIALYDGNVSRVYKDVSGVFRVKTT